MLPHERSLVKKLKGRPFSVVGINSDSKERLQELVADETTTWRNFTDKQDFGKISTSWGVRMWPARYLIDHHGVIKHQDIPDKELDKAISEMLIAAEKAK